jgi:hypothetical protein
MIKWYLRQIEMGRMTLDEVPKRWHDAVEKAFVQVVEKKRRSLRLSSR